MTKEEEEEERSLINRSEQARPTRCRVEPARVSSPQVDLTKYIYFLLELDKGEKGEFSKVAIVSLVTVRLGGMETGISEASKRVPIFSFATQGGKQVSS